MKRHVVAGLFGLALAGCAQSRMAQSNAKKTPDPVSVTSDMPTIHESINSGQPIAVDDAQVRERLAGATGWKNPKPKPAGAPVASMPATVDEPSAAPIGPLDTLPKPDHRPRLAVDQPPVRVLTTPSSEATGAGAAAAATAPAGPPSTASASSPAGAPEAGEAESLSTILEAPAAPGPVSAQPAPVGAPADSPAVAARPAESGPAGPETATAAAPGSPLPAVQPATPAAEPAPAVGVGDALLGSKPSVMPRLDPEPAAASAPAGAPSSTAATTPAPALGLPAEGPAQNVADMAPPSQPSVGTPALESPIPAEPTPRAEPVPTTTGTVIPLTAPDEPAPPTAAPSGAVGTTAPPARGGLPPLPFPSSAPVAPPAPETVPSASNATAPAGTAPIPAAVPVSQAVPTAADAVPVGAELPASATATPRPRARVSVGDSLLGNNPEIMPALEVPASPPRSAVPAAKRPKAPGATQPAVPGGTGALAEPPPGPAPAVLPPAVGGTPAPDGAASGPLPAGPPPLPAPSPLPQAGAPPAASIPIEPIAPLPPVPGSAPPPEPPPPGSAARESKSSDPNEQAALTSAARSIHDPNVVQTGADALAVQTPPIASELKDMGYVIARVGNDVVTFRELSVAWRQFRDKNLRDQKLSRADQTRILDRILNEMIDRVLIVQELHRKIKDAKKFEMIEAAADKEWRDSELPILLRKYGARNETELAQAVRNHGYTVDELREQFRSSYLMGGLISQEVLPRVKVGYSEMMEYYNLHKKEYKYTAYITWREIVIDVRNHETPAKAREKADIALKRLLRGEDFTVVAKALSESPTREWGGLWDKMTPGSYLHDEINKALAVIPVRQVSRVIEAPGSYHIIRVDERAPAGVRSFSEVQNEIREALEETKRAEEFKELVTNLRKRAVIVKETRGLRGIIGSR
jgi:parvulin-like peptidyl-prolyl isomerase